MKIIVNVAEDHSAEVTFDEVTVHDNTSYESLLATFMSVIEGMTKQLLEEVKTTKEDREHLYDALDTLFFTFMERTFPDVQPREFDLSDAAIIMAQDQIIDLAAKEGISFDEAMKKYESRAKEYIRQKRAGYIS